MSGFYALLESKNSSINFNDKYFNSSQIKKNKIWSIKPNLYFIKSEDDNFISSTKLFDYYRLSFEEIKELFKHFMYKNQVFLVDFTFRSFSGCTEEGYDEYELLINLLKKADKTEKDYVEMNELFTFLLDDIQEFHNFTIKMKYNNKDVVFKFYRSCSITKPIDYVIYGKLTENEQEEIIFNFYKEVIEVLNLSDDVSFNEQLLKEHSSVPHPLRNGHKVLEYLLTTYKDEVISQFNISNEEYELIQKSSLKPLESLKDATIYEHQLQKYSDSI